MELKRVSKPEGVTLEKNGSPRDVGGGWIVQSYWLWMTMTMKPFMNMPQKKAGAVSGLSWLIQINPKRKSPLHRQGQEGFNIPEGGMEIC